MEPSGPTSLTVLHVEDDPAFSTLTATRLERTDAVGSILQEATVDDGLARVEAVGTGEGGIDCVVSDYRLDGDDGLAFLRSLRERYPNLPFILFSGEVDDELTTTAFEAGADDCVAKGTGERFETLAARIERAVESARTADALAEKRRQRETFVRNLPGVVYRAAIEDPWEMEFVGGQAEAVTGYPAEAFERREVSFGDDLILPEDNDEVNDTISESVSSGTAFEVTYRIRTADGDLRHVWERGEPVYDGGEAVALEGYIMDITPLREREQRLREQNERLDEFASLVSHDLRNPLNVAVSHVSMLREEVDEPDRLDAIERSLARMESIIEDLLTLAREGRGVTDPTPVSLHEVAHRAWRTVPTDDADLVVADDRRVVADEGRLGRLLENLFRNSVEHAASDGVTVTVGTLDDSDPEGFYVADDGPGIPDERRDAVFDRGYTTAETGTGYGLAIVERIAEAHGWTVAVAGDDDGTRIEFTGVGDA
ncbi:hybrid sensor histidine kinase/response regulator [Halostella salina]|uniref:hybrid sensor histidine kinase/response regulator n=1 Tax=Halostella salina TaxID=1547897 RepID=UPI000EF81CC9|nr:ATP-binding protein [Halostella salina]